MKLEDLSDQNILLMNVRLKLVAFTAQRAHNYANATPALFETLCKPADSDSHSGSNNTTVHSVSLPQGLQVINTTLQYCHMPFKQ